MTVQMLKYGNMELTVELITAEIAARMLARNTTNRRVRPGHVAQYARDMQKGKWSRKPIAICFDESGSLGNGQHTLQAIIDSGIAQEMLIARNAAKECIAAMDLGIRRTMADIAHFIGSDMDSRRSSVARVIGFGVEDPKPRSFDEVFEIYQEHQSAIDFVVAGAPRKCGLNAGVLAACTRATYYYEGSRITRFIEILDTGIAQDSEVAAIRLRDASRTKSSGTAKIRAELYRKAESAIFHFMNGSAVTKLYGSETELFPVPGENLKTPTKYARRRESERPGLVMTA